MNWIKKILRKFFKFLLRAIVLDIMSEGNKTDIKIDRVVKATDIVIESQEEVAE